MKTIQFTIAPHSMKYLGINLTEEVKHLYSENCKTLKKETEQDTNKWKIHFAHGLEELLLKCPYYLKQYTDSMQSLLKYQWHSSQN